MKDNRNFWRSTLTGDCFPMDADWMPKYDGYELIHYDTFAKWCIENGLQDWL